MKNKAFKFLTILALLCTAFVAQGQTSTIDDHGPYITINYDTGDTVSLGKDMVVQTKVEDGFVFIMTAFKWSPGNLTKMLSLRPSDFSGFSTTRELQDYLNAVLFRKYDLRLVYDGSGNNDTVYYEYDGTTEFISVMTYSGSDLATQKYVTQ